jgi:hypothetical protein
MKTLANAFAVKTLANAFAVKTLANERDLAEIQRRLKTVGPDSKRRWGRMTAHQMVCHLSDSFLGVTGRRHLSVASGPLQRTVLKWVALHAPLRWPAGYPTRPEIDQAIGGTRPGDFARDVALLATLLSEFATDPPALDGLRHPVFGPMSTSEWLRWAYLHMDHHLRQFGS